MCFLLRGLFFKEALFGIVRFFHCFFSCQPLPFFPTKRFPFSWYKPFPFVIIPFFLVNVSLLNTSFGLVQVFLDSSF
ncbi:hypothetical protein CW304_19165 [Bacillus sp. UFRGS-B20]|nr:hypothetical protein CW304_19165 [Bacillus sp. UFRGS-B20]